MNIFEISKNFSISLISATHFQANDNGLNSMKSK